MPDPRSTARSQRRWTLLAALAGIGLAVPFVTRGSAATTAASETTVLVGFKQPAYTLSRATRSAILSRSRERQRIVNLRGTIHRQFSHADAMVASLSPDAITALARDPSVAYVEEDHVVHLLQSVETPPTATDPAAPILIPWGIGGDDQTAGVRALDAGATGEGVKVGIVDTGVGPHPDLEVVGGYNFVANSTDYHDDVGHGTHVG